jgi:Flp pilus assembly pilin Flp
LAAPAEAANSRMLGRLAGQDGVLRWPTRLLRDETGQDLVEYALISAAIGVSAALCFYALLSAFGIAYSGFVAGANGLWVPPPPS